MPPKSLLYAFKPNLIVQCTTQDIALPCSLPYPIPIPWAVLGTLSIRPLPRPRESKSVFQQDLIHIAVQEALS